MGRVDVHASIHCTGHEVRVEIAPRIEYHTLTIKDPVSYTFIDVFLSSEQIERLADLLVEYVDQMHDENVTDEHIASTIADRPVQVE